MSDLAAEPSRESLGLLLAWLDGDDDLVLAFLDRYDLTGQALDLCLELLKVAALDRDPDEFEERLYELALAKAAR